MGIEKEKHQNNVGTLRFIGAFMVLFGHSFNLSHESNPADPISLLIWNYMPWDQPMQTLGVILFFGMSGYLVTKSYLNKNNLFDYLLARCMRIYPALIVAVLFCVFVIGLLHTSMPTMDYLQHPVTQQYWWVNSTLKSVRFTLPGVFEEWPLKLSVNGSLWTLPVEFRLYLLVAALGVLRIFSYRWLFNLLALLGIGVFLCFPQIFPALLAPQKPFLVLSFMLGVFFCINEKIFSLDIKKLCALLLLCCLFWYWNIWQLYDYLALLTFISAVLYIGLLWSVKMPALDRFGDFSYGLYLYAFPVQQTLVGLLGPGRPYTLLFVSLLCTLAIAVLSWYFIEKPAMGLARKISSRINAPAKKSAPGTPIPNEN